MGLAGRVLVSGESAAATIAVSASPCSAAAAVGARKGLKKLPKLPSEVLELPEELISHIVFRILDARRVSDSSEVAPLVEDLWRNGMPVSVHLHRKNELLEHWELTVDGESYWYVSRALTLRLTLMAALL